MSTAANWYNDVMDRIDRKSSTADRWEDFKVTHAFRFAMEEATKDVLRDNDTVVEAIGPDGWKFGDKPFSTSADTWKAFRAKEEKWESEFIQRIARTIAENDEAELGKLIMAHAKRYIAELAEDDLREAFE